MRYMPAEWISSLLVERLVSANRKFSCAVPSNTTAPIIEKGQQEALPCNCGPFVVAVEAASGGFRQVDPLANRKVSGKAFKRFCGLYQKRLGFRFASVSEPLEHPFLPLGSGSHRLAPIGRFDTSW